MAPINRSHVKVAKPMIAKSTTAECKLRSRVSSLTVRTIGTKDRHSKVRTSKGLRDRRVRLSAQTAVQFFEVQDRLGFDQPSKALDWLIRHARTAIDELAPLEPVDLNSERYDTAMESASQEIKMGQDVDEPLESTLEHQQSGGLHGGSMKWAQNQTQDSTEEKTISDKVLPIMSAQFTSASMSVAAESFLPCESKHPSTQQLPSGNCHPIHQSIDTLPQPQIPHSVELPTYSLYASSESSSPLILNDFPHQLYFSAPAAAPQTSHGYSAACISPGGTLQSIFNYGFTDFQ